MHKKILIIENSLYFTGGLKAILSIADLLRSEFEFHFIIPAKSKIGMEITEKGFKVVRLPFLEINKSFNTLIYLPRLYRNARKVQKYMKKESITVLHVNDVFNMVGCMVKRFEPGIHLVYHVRLLKDSYIAPLYLFFLRWVKKYASYILCVSEAVRKDIGYPFNSVVMYENPVKEELYEAWNGLKEPGSLRILYLANYVRGKGQEYGLRAFIEVHKKYPLTTLVFAGDITGPASEKYKQSLVSEAEKAGVASNVIFNGKVTDVEKEMKYCDVVLNLSESESFSFVCLEAMLYGVPLIAADSGGPAELTAKGDKAFLVSKKDHTAASNALLYLIQHPKEVKERATIARKWAIKKFDMTYSKAILSRVYANTFIQ